jgi:hypothetical protein
MTVSLKTSSPFRKLDVRPFAPQAGWKGDDR